mgnify:CR=1 FL=1
MKVKHKVLLLTFLSICFSCKVEKIEKDQKLIQVNTLTEKEIKLKELGLRYFKIWTATQAVNAAKNDIENYLNLLMDDVGHQHYPYDKDDSRAIGNKESMRKGMLYYLGVHTEYNASLKSLVVGDNVIIIKFRSSSKGIHPQTKKEISSTKNTVEVLEVENGKISMIRKYRE